MQRWFISLLTLLLLVACGGPRGNGGPSSPPQVLDRSTAGNGGDSIRLLFRQGLMHATGVLERLDERGFTPKVRRSLLPGEMKWLLDNRTEIAKEMENSPFDFGPNPPESDSPVFALRVGRFRFPLDGANRGHRRLQRSYETRVPDVVPHRQWLPRRPTTCQTVESASAQASQRPLPDR